MSDERLREAERRYQARLDNETYHAFALAAARAGDPLVRFVVHGGGSIEGPRDPDNRVAFLYVEVSGRADPAALQRHEWVGARISQYPLSQLWLANLIAQSMSANPEALTTRWLADPTLQFRLNAASAQLRIEAAAVKEAAFPQLYRNAGFSLWQTGGGCTAWAKEASPEGRHVLITGDGIIPQVDDEEIVVGLYDEFGNYLDGSEFRNTYEGALTAIQEANRLLAP